LVPDDDVVKVANLKILMRKSLTAGWQI